MPDYNLFGLSARAFEQLVQALSIKILGSNVIVFGDGPDGAREATFHGKVSYPNLADPWGGYGIVQAKFLQRPNATPKEDADWLLHHISQEMKKFKKKGAVTKKKRSSPDYYILATNVVLSPMEEKGGKDRVTAALDQYQRNLGWQAYDVWDGDKLNKFLDADRNVATAYAAWITAGDVLDAVIKSLSPVKPEFHQIMFTYLQKELLAAQFANLRQAGHTDQDRVALSRVFVDLPVSDKQLLEPPNETKHRHGVKNFLADLLAEGSFCHSESQAGLGMIAPILAHLDTELPTLFTQASVRQHAVKDIIARWAKEPTIQLSEEVLDVDAFSSIQYDRWFAGRRSGRIVLLGGPGQGKTTVGQFACQIYRASLLLESKGTITREAREALDLIKAQSGKTLAKAVGRRYPIHVDLKALAAFLAKDVENPPSLLEFIRTRIGQRACTEVSIEDIKLWLNKYPWFVVFDGLDEVPASSDRAGTMRAIREFFVDADAVNADLLVLATCRPQSYAKEFDDKRYRHIWLVPLSEERAQDYGKRLLAVRHAPGPDLDNYLTRLSTAASNTATARLMRSPLQVAIMAALVERVGLPPEQRWTLFSEYYRVIYDRETERGTQWSNTLRDFRTDVDVIHRQIGFVLHEESEKGRAIESSLSHTEFRDLVSRRLTKEGHTGHALSSLTETLCEAVKDRLVFLTALTDKRIGFEIRSLQEFMAADYIMDAPDAAAEKHHITVRDNLRLLALSSHWRNVFLFVVGRVYARDQHFRDAVEALCAEMNESDHEVLSLAHAGSRLALEILEDGSVRNQPKSARVLMRVSARLLDTAPSAVHARLVEQISNNTEFILKEEVERRLRTTNTLLWVSGWNVLARLCHKEVKWAEDLLETVTPTDDTAWALALSATPKFNGRSKVNELLANKAWRIPMPEWVRWHRINGPMPKLIPVEPGMETFAEVAECALRQMNELAIVTFEEEAASSPLRMPFREHPNLVLKLYSLQAHTGKLALREKLGPWHPTWQVYASALRFARQPSADLLAEELESLCNSWQLPNTVPRLGFGSWVFLACLRACNSLEDISTLSSRVRAGEIGDVEDWKAAEERWQQEGLTCDDFSQAWERGLPFTGRIREVGVPFQSASLELEGAFPLEILETLLAKDGTRNGGTIKTDVAEFIERLQMFMRSSDTGKYDRERIISIFDEIQRGGIGISPGAVLLSTAQEEMTEVYQEFLDRMGRARFERHSLGLADNGFHRLRKEYCGSLARAFVAAPQRVGLARLLSYCPPDWVIQCEVSQALLTELAEREPSLRDVVLVLTLDQLAWNVEQTKGIADRIIEGLDVRPDLLRRVCKVTQNIMGSDEKRERLLARLLELLPVGDYRNRGAVTEALVVLVGRRTSGLNTAPGAA